MRNIYNSKSRFIKRNFAMRLFKIPFDPSIDANYKINDISIFE